MRRNMAIVYIFAVIGMLSTLICGSFTAWVLYFSFLEPCLREKPSKEIKAMKKQWSKVEAMQH